MSENMSPIEFDFLPETDVFGGPVGYRQYVDQTAKEIIAEDAASELVPVDWMEEVIFPDMQEDMLRTMEVSNSGRPMFTKKHYEVLAGKIGHYTDTIIRIIDERVYQDYESTARALLALRAKLETQQYYIILLHDLFKTDNPNYDAGRWLVTTGYHNIYPAIIKVLDRLESTER